MKPSDDDLLYANKRPSELGREDLAKAAVHFRDAHVESVHRMAAMQRRMAKLEEAVPKAKVEKLDRWLKVHAIDALRGDGSEQYPNWQKWDG
jgi:phage tail tape-measure protein